VSHRQGWPLHVIEQANDAPAIEQPEAFVRAIRAELQRGHEPRTRSSTPARADGTAAREAVDTLVIGGGQAGLATSYWLTQAGVQHIVLEARDRVGGGWNDRWDSFHLVAPNFTLRLPGMPYSGPEPDAFMPRDQVIEYVKEYAASFAAPLRLASRVTRLTAASDGSFEAHMEDTLFTARRVVLATGAYQRPKVPALSDALPAHIQQLHSHDYRRPAQLARGAVLVVGTGQSGTQIAEELQRAGRDVHLALSRCASAPRRYRGRDLIWWLYQCLVHGAEVGVPFPSVDDLPTPAARFACNPHLSGTDGGHDISLRRFARQGMHLYGALEAIDGSIASFSDDLAARLHFAETGFDEELRPLLDAYITAARIDAPPDDRPAPERFTPTTPTQLDLERAGVASVLWATGYRPDFDWVRLPVFDAWGYPKHVRGVTIHPGLYAVGLPWLHSEASSVFAGVGADAAHIVDHLVAAPSLAPGR
jgi:putative flavoprotein involved in K+ transport